MGVYCVTCGVKRRKSLSIGVLVAIVVGMAVFAGCLSNAPMLRLRVRSALCR